jgi:hypothetical protein
MSRAKTSGSSVAWASRISRQAVRTASSDATSPPAAPPMPSHTTANSPRGPVAVIGWSPSNSSPTSRSPIA